MLPKEDLDMLFSNLETISLLNNALYAELDQMQQRSFVITGIGELFLKQIDKFRLYSVYCSNQPFSSNQINEIKLKNEQFKNFLVECSRKPECRHLLLSDFLIMPVQRICKYPLLLKDIYNHTPAGHPDHAVLGEALAKVREVVDLVNERTRKIESLQISIEIETKLKNGQGYELMKRRLIRRGECNLIQKKKPKSGQLFLFEDLLMIVKKNKKKPDMFEIVSAFDLPFADPATIASEVEEEQTSFEVSGFGFEGQSTKARFDSQKLQFPTTEQAKSWAEIINHTVSYACRREKSALRYCLTVEMAKKRTWNPFKSLANS